MSSTPTDTETFSARIRHATTGAHRAAERSPIMTKLLAGRLRLEEFVAMQVQLLNVYETLEELGQRHRSDAVAGVFVDDALVRAPALRADLVALAALGAHDHHGLTPATQRYCARLRQIAPDPVAFVAHHYTRYLGDLSGGQYMCRALERHLDLGPDRGSAFFHFEHIDPEAYKVRYRERLDDAAWSASEHQRFLDEVHLAYALNSDLLESIPIASSE